MKHNWKTWGRTILVLALLGLMTLRLVSSVSAGDFRGGDNVVISAEEVIDDDLFASGNRVEVNGTVKGDLFATGRDVVVNGTVEGSLFISGQTLDVNGQISGSVYSAGYALTIGSEADIGRNLYFGGFSLTSEPGSTVGRSVYTGSYQAIVNGEVANDIAVSAGALEVNGSVGGDVKGEVSDAEGGAPPFMPAFPGSVPAVAPGLRVSDDAQVGGVVDVAIAEPGPEAAQRPRDRGIFGLGRAITSRIGEFIALLIVGGLLLYFWPGVMRRASSEAKEKPLPSAGRGCLVTLIFPIGVFLAGIVVVVLAVVLGLLTFGQLLGDVLGIGGATLALAVAVFVFIVSIITKAIVAFLGGRLILDRLAPQSQSSWLNDFAALALGALIYEILRAIPILGLIVAAIVILVGLGAIFVTIRERIQLRPAEAMPPAEAAA
jgi:hypothetical protein